MNKLICSTIFLIVLVLAACKSTRVVSTGNIDKMTAKILAKEMNANAFDFKTFSGKAKVGFKTPQINQSFTVNIRIEKNKVIWMSLTGPFSIEGARILITPDEIQIIDKLNSKYYKQPFNFIGNFIPFEVDFEMIEALIIGNSLGGDFSKQTVETIDAKYHVKGKMQEVEVLYTILPVLFRYENVEMKNLYNAQEGDIIYKKYEEVAGQNFSMERLFSFSDAQDDVNIHLHFNKVKVNEDITFPFRIPERYERIE